MKSKKAYTLIEMLMVVAIIGILASSILVGLGSARSKARDSRRISDLKNVQTALELYYSKYGSYPGGGQNWNWSDLVSIITSEETGLNIAKLPKDPLNNDKHQYLYGSDGQSYVLGVKLETKDASLDDDLDGMRFNIDCGEEVGDTVYCVSI